VLSRMVRTVITLCAFIVLVGALRVYAVRKFPPSPRPRKIAIRILADIHQTPVTSFGLNNHVFIAELAGRDQTQLVKLVYHYLIYEQNFPRELLQADLLHRFVAQRDISCDENFERMSTSVIRNGEGEEHQVSAVRYLIDEPPHIESTYDLPCYVIGPQGYRGTHRLDVQGKRSK